VVGNVAVANTGGGMNLEGGAHATSNGVYGNTLLGLLIFEPSFSGDIEGNNIFGNGVGVGSFNNCGLSNGYSFGTPGVPAPNNYWGASTGPGADPADDVRNATGGTTTVTPFAGKPFKVKPTIKP